MTNISVALEKEPDEFVSGGAMPFVAEGGWEVHGWEISDNRPPS